MGDSLAYRLRPSLHDGPPALEQVGALVGGDRRGAFDVRQAELRNAMVNVMFGRPTAKTTPQPVRRACDAELAE